MLIESIWYLGLMALVFESVMWERNALKSFIYFLLYIKHAMFPSSNFVEEIPTSKQHIVQSGHPSSPLRVTVADSLSTGKTPPSTNILNSGDVRTSFLFGQPVAKKQMKTVVYLSLGMVCSAELIGGESRCSCGWLARTQESPQPAWASPMVKSQMLCFSAFSWSTSQSSFALCLSDPKHTDKACATILYAFPLGFSFW